MLNDLPDPGWVQSQMIMDEDIAEAGYVASGGFGIAIFQTRRKVLGGLSELLQFPQGCLLSFPVVEESFLATSQIFLDSVELI